MKQTIGQFLAMLRRESGLTQAEVAEKLGISDRTLSSWERDTRYPDILLLPELADLYGVTADEILRGERKVETPHAEGAEGAAPDPDRGQTNAQAENGPEAGASATAKYAVWACAVIGFVFAACACIVLGAYHYYGAGWGQPLYAFGWVLFGVCAALLLAVFFAARGASKGKRDLSFARGVKNTALIFSLFPLLSGAVCLVSLASDNWRYTVTALTGGALLGIALLVALFAFVCHWRLLSRCGEGESVRRDLRLILRVGGIGSVPLLLAVAVLVSFWYIKPQRQDILYSSADREEFIAHAESIDVHGNAYHFMNGIPEGEYFFDISRRYGAGEGETVHNAATGEDEFVMTFEGGFTAYIRKGGQDCALTYTSENGEEGWVASALREKIGDECFYPLRFDRPAYSHHPDYQNPFYTGEGMFYFRDGEGNFIAQNYANFDYSPLTNAVCGVAIVCDVATCTAIVAVKRRR